MKKMKTNVQDLIVKDENGIVDVEKTVRAIEQMRMADKRADKRASKQFRVRDGRRQVFETATGAKKVSYDAMCSFVWTFVSDRKAEFKEWLEKYDPSLFPKLDNEINRDADID